MQIPTKQFAEMQLKGMSTLQRELQDVQARITTGRNLLHTYDAPTTAYQVAALDSALSQAARRTSIVQYAQAQLALREQVLSESLNLINRVKEITVVAANSTASLADRQNFATELRQISLTLRDLANTTDPSGSAVFGGYKTADVAYTLDADGKADYRGDAGPRTGVALLADLGLDETADQIFGGIVSNDSLTDVFTILESAADTLDTNQEPTAALGDIELAFSQFSKQLTKVGTGQQQAERVAKALDASILTLKEERSPLADADVAALAVQLSQGITALQAAQQSFIKLQQLTLFDLMK